MNGKHIMKATGIGILSGLLLSFMLKGIQQLTGDKVYTLLLNVDYFPILKHIQFSEPVEVLFHLIVSVILCIIITYFYIHSGSFFSRYVVWMTMLLNVVIGMLLFPTTTFSERTPELMDGSAFFWWLAGHAVYGVVAGFFIRRWFEQKEPGRI